MSKRLLFISHVGTRTGSPLVLLAVLRWIKNNTDAECRVLFRAGGPLVPEFEALAECRVLPVPGKSDASLPLRAWHKLAACPAQGGAGRSRVERGLRRTAATIQSRIDERWMRDFRSCDLVYVNSIASAGVVRALAPDAPLLMHVHESDYSLHWLESRDDVAFALGGTHPIITTSAAVRATLVNDFAVTPSRVTVIHAPVRPRPDDSPRDPHERRRVLGIPATAFVVGAAGTVEWRKGPDLFVQLARALRTRRPDIDAHLIWVGEDPSPGGMEQIRARFDAERAGVDDRVHFAGAHANPWPFYELMDVFSLVSRSEPLGLVALEAASVALPVVCFEQAGGMPEFVSDGGGYVVPYLAVDEMADRIAELHDDASLRSALGQQSVERLRSEYDPETLIRRIVELVFETAR